MRSLSWDSSMPTPPWSSPSPEQDHTSLPTFLACATRVHRVSVLPEPTPPMIRPRVGRASTAMGQSVRSPWGVVAYCTCMRCSLLLGVPGVGCSPGGGRPYAGVAGRAGGSAAAVLLGFLPVVEVLVVLVHQGSVVLGVAHGWVFLSGWCGGGGGAAAPVGVRRPGRVSW